MSNTKQFTAVVTAVCLCFLSDRVAAGGRLPAHWAVTASQTAWLALTLRPEYRKGATSVTAEKDIIFSI